MQVAQWVRKEQHGALRAMWPPKDSDSPPAKEAGRWQAKEEGPKRDNGVDGVATELLGALSRSEEFASGSDSGTSEDDDV